MYTDIYIFSPSFLMLTPTVFFFVFAFVLGDADHGQPDKRMNPESQFPSAAPFRWLAQATSEEVVWKMGSWSRTFTVAVSVSGRRDSLCIVGGDKRAPIPSGFSLVGQSFFVP